MISIWRKSHLEEVKYISGSDIKLIIQLSIETKNCGALRKLSYFFFKHEFWRNALPTPHLADLPSILSNTYLQPQPSNKMIDQRIFENLQTKIDEESTVRDVSQTNASGAWWILRAPSLHRRQDHWARKTARWLTILDRSYMKLSTHLPEEVCSAIHNFDQDFWSACPAGDDTPRLKSQVEHENWCWMIQDVPHRLSCRELIPRPLISVSIYYLYFILWWEGWCIIPFDFELTSWSLLFSLSFLRHITFESQHVSTSQHFAPLVYSLWIISLISTTVKPVLDDVTKEILAQKEEVARLKAVADQHPFYKYNGLWTRELQNLVCFWNAMPEDFCWSNLLGRLYWALRMAGRTARAQGTQLNILHDHWGCGQVPG